MKKILLMIVVIAIVGGALGGGAFYLMNKNNPVTLTPVESSSPNTPLASGSTGNSNQTPEGQPMFETIVLPEPNTVGSVFGKLCYPSSFLPPGEIEAKEVTSQKVSTLPYVGSQNGGYDGFVVKLPPGVYVFRYKAIPDKNKKPIYGYHTEQCAKGDETTCAKDNPRTLKKIELKAEARIENVNLCDFYYDTSKEPTF